MNRKNIIKKIIALSIIIILFIYGNNIDYKYLTNISNQKITEENEKLKIYFLDVGQAECFLIKIEDKYILIDAGNNINSNRIVKYFKKNNIKEFEYIIATHPHEDHIGGMSKIIYNFDTKHFLMPNIKVNIKSYDNLLKALKKKNIEIETPKIDAVYNIDNLKLKILFIGNDNENINDSAIIVKIEYKETSYLFTSDASKEVELKIINKDIKSDVLKIGHHGSQYSSSAQFLKKVNPKYAIISVGKDNDYNFPKEITLEKLEKLNIKTYRTDIDKTILVKSDGKNIEVSKIDIDNKY